MRRGRPIEYGDGGARFYRELIAGRRAALRILLGKGQARGELATDRDLDLLLDLIYGPLWYRLLLRHAPLDEGFIEQLLGALDLVASDSVRERR